MANVSRTNKVAGTGVQLPVGWRQFITFRAASLLLSLLALAAANTVCTLTL